VLRMVVTNGVTELSSLWRSRESVRSSLRLVSKKIEVSNCQLLADALI
jgi:hypothetical protein